MGTPSELLIKKASKGTYADGKNLITKGANPNYTDNKGLSVLHVATHFQNKDFIKLLFDNHANINVADNNGITPLNDAIHSKSLDLIKLFIEKGADVNYAPNPKISPLLTALNTDSTDILKILIDAGADLNHGYTENGFFSCPLSAAKKVETLEFLLKNGANPNFYLDVEQDLPYIFILLHSKSYSMLSVALKNGANPNIQGKPSKTSPLHAAVMYKDLEAVRLLLQHGADKDNVNLQLKKPIDIATELDLTEIIKLLSTSNTQLSDRYRS